MSGAFLASVQRLDLLLREHLPQDVLHWIHLYPFADLIEARRFAQTADRTFGGLMRSPPGARSLRTIGNALADLNAHVLPEKAGALAQLLVTEWMETIGVEDEVCDVEELAYDRKHERYDLEVVWHVSVQARPF